MSPLRVLLLPRRSGWNWSDGFEIEFSVRKGSFSSLTGIELWIFDNNNAKYVFGVGS